MLVDYIELEGQKLPICFPISAFAEFERQSGIASLEMIAQFEAGAVSMQHISQLLSAGLNAGARKTGTGIGMWTSEVAGDMLSLTDIPKLMPILSRYLSIQTEAEAGKNAEGATEAPAA